MITAQKYTVDIAANGPLRLPLSGMYFRIISCTGAVDVVTDNVNLQSCNVGDGFEKTPFGFLAFRDRSAAPNTVTFVIADEAFLNAPTSAVQVTSAVPIRDTLANTARTVTTASAQLVAASASRSYLKVQNKSASGSIWLNHGAGAATTANGFRIGPGGFHEWDQNVPVNAIQAIGDIASNADVVTIEG